MASTLLNSTSSAQTRSSLSLDNDLKNPVMVTKGGRLERARIMWDFFFNKPADTRPAGRIPLQALTKTQLLTAPDNTVYRLGHSTVLMKLHHTFCICPRHHTQVLQKKHEFIPGEKQFKLG